MGIEIVNPKTGKTTIKISDDGDQSKDLVVEDGKEVSYDEAAAKKEQEVEDTKKDNNVEDKKDEE